MIQYPLQFKVSSDASAGISTQWSAQSVSGLPEVRVAIPPEFEGPGQGYSPEDLYAFALMSCFIATFKVIAERSKLQYESIKAEGVLTVDRNESGAPWMKAFHLVVKLGGASDRERALRLLEKTSQSCLVLNSVRTEKTFDFQV